MTKTPAHPGLRKAKAEPLLRRRVVELWHTSDYRIRQLFESADVMSEGAPRSERDGHTYYGMTSIVLPTQAHGGHVPDAQLAQIMQLIACDPHARLRAVRIAWREAQVRASVPLGQLRADLSFSTTRQGIKIDVDVEARLQERLSSRSAG